MNDIEHVREIESFLRQPAAYPHGPERVEIVHTHISCVAIAPPFVYKLKKPVRLGFLDFSTLERRRHFCQEEVRLNRRLCGHVYEGVVAISRTATGLAFGDTGTIVDYVVKMKYLEPDYFLDELLQRGIAGRPHIDRIVDVLVPFYTAQTPSDEVTRWGSVDKIRVSTDENFEQMRPFAGQLLTLPAYRALVDYTERFFGRHRALFEQRRLEGRILDCHGDLHAEHIHLAPDRVCIYDCIEFNERFRYVDVASDTAFLAMDLDHRGHPDLARYFAGRMAGRMSDPELHTLLPFYQAYRAFVRGKVAAIKSLEEEVALQEREAARDEARAYFRRAVRYTICAGRPVVVAVMGRPASGKSTQARLLAESTGWVLLSSDITRKQLAGVPVFERSAEPVREALYTQAMTDRTYRALFDRAIELAGRGEGTVIDATFSARATRDALRARLDAAGIPYYFVEITASDASIEQRLAARDEAAGEVSDARLEDFEFLSRRYQPPEMGENVIVVSSEQPPEKTALELLKRLATV